MNDEEKDMVLSVMKLLLKHEEKIQRLEGALEKIIPKVMKERD